MSYILDALKKSEQQRQAQLPEKDLATNDIGKTIVSEAVQDGSNAPVNGKLLMTLFAVLVVFFLLIWNMAGDDVPAKQVAPVIAPQAFISEEPAKPAQSAQLEAKSVPAVIPNTTTAPENILQEVDIFAADPVVSQGIPAIAITSHIYSSLAAKRSIVVNDQRLQEGDGIAPGIVIESITPKGMVIRYKNNLLSVDRGRGWR